MSISLIEKSTQKTIEVVTGSQFISLNILKRLASLELECQISQLKVFHLDTDKQFGENQVIKQGQKIKYSIARPEQTQFIQNRQKGIIYPEELQKIIQTAKIIVIKSANQQNIQKSKEISLWATTYSNQQRLKYFFNNFPHVILIFATHRSFQIKGLARMETEPQRNADKTVWSGVSNIRLGGNFKIKWLRKKPLSLVIAQKNIGTNFKQNILKSCDGQQLDPQFCKKLAYIFEIPSEPYYLVEQKKQEKLEKSGFKNNSEILQPLMTTNISPFWINPLISNSIAPPKVSTNEIYSSQKKIPEPQNSYLRSKSSESSVDRKRKKIKKDKNKKNKNSKKHKKQHKRKHRKYSESSSYQSSGSEDDYSSNSSSVKKKHKQRRKNKKKDKKNKKQKRRS